MSSLRNATLTVSVGINAQPNSADTVNQVKLTDDGRIFGEVTINVANGMTVAYQNISMAVNTTGGDLQLDAFVDALSGDTIAFAKIAAIIVTNSTDDPTALIYADAGATNGWTAPYSGWRAFCYGRDASGGYLPCFIANFNTATSFDWDVANGATDTINLNSNTPATATTLTGRLIIIGWV